MDESYDAEIRKAELREEILQKLGKRDGIVFIGPVTYTAEGGVICGVRVLDASKVGFSDQLQVKLSGETRSIALRIEEGPALRATDMCPGETAGQVEPTKPPGADAYLRGGDACWPDGHKDQYGTVSIAAKHLTIRDNVGNEVDAGNACLTAAHVFGQSPNPGDPLKAYGLDNPILFSGRVALDAALGVINDDDVDNYATGRIRGFGKFKKASVRPPTDGNWITCIGAKSGITIGLDKGAITDGGQYNGFRIASAGFSCCHDSGALVMDKAGFLIGMVVAGEALDCHLRPLSLYMPFRVWDNPGSALINDLELLIKNR